MAILIIMIALGLLVGIYVRPLERYNKWIDGLTTVVIWLLILFMGISFGMKLEYSMLRALGIQSLLITFFSCLFSVLFVYCIVRRDNRKEDER